MNVVPILGPLIILVFAVMPSSPSGVRFDRRPTESGGHTASAQHGYPPPPGDGQQQGYGQSQQENGPAYGQEAPPSEGGYSADPYGR